MTVSELAQKLNLKVIALPCGERKVCGAYACDLLSWVMGRAKADDAWITIMSNINIIAVASLSDVACIILADGVIPEKDVIELGIEKGVNILTSNKPIFETAVSLSNQNL